MRAPTDEHLWNVARDPASRLRQLQRLRARDERAGKCLLREGWDITASPRHADVVTVTGPMTEAMRAAARATLEAVPQPSIVVAIGDCAAGEGPWHGPPVGDGAGVELEAGVTVRGCPPTPDDIRAGLRRAAELLDAASGSGRRTPL
jgi:Ni,Fe-hydrogenase III small subunit